MGPLHAGTVGKTQQIWQNCKVARVQGARVGAIGAISLREASLRGLRMRRPGGAMERSRRDLRIHQPRGRASMARFLYRT